MNSVGDVIQRISNHLYKKLLQSLQYMQNQSEELRTIQLRNLVTHSKQLLYQLRAVLLWLSKPNVLNGFRDVEEYHRSLSFIEEKITRTTDEFFFLHANLYSMRTKQVEIIDAQDLISSNTMAGLPESIFTCGRPIFPSVYCYNHCNSSYNSYTYSNSNSLVYSNSVSHSYDNSNCYQNTTTNNKSTNENNGIESLTNNDMVIDSVDNNSKSCSTVSMEDIQIVNDLNIYIKSKIVLYDPIPERFKVIYTISDGILSIVLPSYFELYLTLNNLSEFGDWTVLGFRILVQSSNSLVSEEIIDHTEIENVILKKLQDLTCAQDNDNDDEVVNDMDIVNETNSVTKGPGSVSNSKSNNSKDLLTSHHSESSVHTRQFEQEPRTLKLLLKLCHSSVSVMSLRILYSQALRSVKTLYNDRIAIRFNEYKNVSRFEMKFFPHISNEGNYKYGLLLLQIRNSKYYNYDRNNLKSFLIVQYNTNPKFLKFKSIINALIGNKIDLKSSIYDDQSEASDADMESTLLNSISDEIVYGAGFNKYDNSWHVIPNFDAIINGEKYIENGVTFYNLLQDSLTVCSQYKLLIIFHRILATVQSTRASMKLTLRLKYTSHKIIIEANKMELTISVDFHSGKLLIDTQGWNLGIYESRQALQLFLMELNGVESEDFVAYCMELTGISATINNAVETFIYLDKSISTKKVGVSIMTLSTFETVLHHMYLVSTAAAILDTVNLSNMMENMLNIKLLIMGDFKIPVVVLCIADNTGNTNNGNTNANTERSLWLAISFDDGKHDANNSTSGDSKELRIIECTAYSVVNEKLVSKKEVDINNALDLEVRTQLLHAVEMAKVWASSGTDQFTKLN